MEGQEDLEFAPTLQNLIDQTELKWIFVGGKGGVGKTTTSSSIAVEMSKHRENVLLISTDPAHNLSDAFDQKFSGEPTQVKGFTNLYCMEIDPQAQQDDNQFFKGISQDTEVEGGMNFLKELMSSVPGIDEATSFGEVMKNLDKYKFEVIIFDTAPTGHTLRLLNFPKILEKGLLKVMQLREKFGGMINQVQTMMGQGGANNQADMQQKMFEQLDNYKKKIEEINVQFQDNSRTTFVAVMIPEFLSMYETERLAIELTKMEIDIHNIVINQVLFPSKTSTCEKCVARRKMQDKYLTQIKEIYDDFHITVNPQLNNEVRGVPLLKDFGKMLFEGYVQNHDE